MASDPYHLPYYLEPSLPTLDYLSQNFPSDESILEIMSVDEPIWEYHHHKSSFLPNASSLYFDFVSLISTNIVKNPQTPVLLQGTNSEGNLCNITQMTPVDISMNPGALEHVHIGHNYSKSETKIYTTLFKEFQNVFPWSYEEIPGIYPSILIHEIKTYPPTKLVRKKIRQIHPKKTTALKTKVEKNLKVGFIYPMSLT